MTPTTTTLQHQITDHVESIRIVRVGLTSSFFETTKPSLDEVQHAHHCVSDFHFKQLYVQRTTTGKGNYFCFLEIDSHLEEMTFTSYDPQPGDKTIEIFVLCNNNIDNSNNNSNSSGQEMIRIHIQK